MKANVLYVFADQLSLQALHVYGASNTANTPHIDELAEKGVRFNQSYCVTPQCSPSRSSILTGLYPHKTKVAGNIGTKHTEDLDPKLPNIGNLLKTQGYRTGYFGKWHLGTIPLSEYGFDETADFHGDDEETTSHALKFLDRQVGLQEAQPWLCMVSYNNPHDIYHVVRDKRQGKQLDTSGVSLPESFIDDLSAKPEAQRLFRDEDQGEPLREYQEEDWKYYLAYYYELVEAVDRQLGRLIAELKETGQYEETLIVFTSDHGDLMAAHRAPFKGPMMYDELVKIPLIYSWTGVLQEGQSRDQFTVNTDHMPTVLDLLGIELPKGLDGVSMKQSLLNGETPGREYVILQYLSKQKWINPIRTVLDGEYKYNWYNSGEEELYDMRSASSEVHNLTGDPDYSPVKNRLKTVLSRWMTEHRDPFPDYIRTDRAGNPIVRQPTI